MKRHSVYKKSSIALIILIATLFSIQEVFAVGVFVTGRIRYWDNEANAYRPLVNAETHIETYNPTIDPTPVLYTDANGEYSYYTYHYPDQVTVRVFFRNSKIDLRQVYTTHSESVINLKTIRPPCPHPEIPCYPWLTPPDFENMNMDFINGSNNANYAKIFTLANFAADFAIANGFVPPRCVVKYPAEQSIMTDISVPVSSFYWPFSTVSTGLIHFLGIGGYILDFLGHTGEVTEHAVYITGSVVQPNWRTTVFHEYGHFVMAAARGWNWPVTLQEYINGDVPFGHSWSDANQNELLAFLEGWANFYGSAVESWLYSPASPYSGRFLNDGYVWSDIFESSSHPWPPPTNGYRHELYIGRAFFDLYDPTTGGDADGFQTSFQNILTVISERHSVMPEYLNVFAHKPFLSDQQRNAAIGIMSALIMDPLASYGNATMYVTNDFQAGVVNIDNSDIQTGNYTNGLVPQTQLWMSNKRLQAKEQLYGGYQRLFKHTDPLNPGFDWTTQLFSKKNLTEVWNTYVDPLTFTANFDRLCNVTVNYQVFDGGSIPSTTTDYRAGTSASIHVPDQIINGITYVFTKWSDGSTDNPRVVLVNGHLAYTAVLKAHLASSLSTATGPSNQRKMMNGYDGKYHLVYSSGGEIWYSSSSNAVNWLPEFRISNGLGTSSNPSLNCWADPNYAYTEVAWVQDNNVVYREYSSFDGWHAIENPNISAYGVASSPAVAQGWVAADCYGSVPRFQLKKRISFNNWSNSIVFVSGSKPVVLGDRYDCHIAYEESSSGRILYNEGHMSSDLTTFSWAGPTFVVSDGSGRTNNAAPSLASDANMQGRLYVAWQGMNPLNNQSEIIVRRGWPGNWSPMFTYFGSGLPSTPPPPTFSNPVVMKLGGTSPNFYDMALVWSVSDNSLRGARYTTATDRWAGAYRVGTGIAYAPTIAKLEDGSQTSALVLYTEGTSSPFALTSVVLPPTPQIVCSVLDGWNMTGIPLVVFDFAKAAVYPTATSNAFAYNNGYVVTDPLSNNRGWWIKFGGAQSITYEGDVIHHMEMVANNGWNIIGSISDPVQVGTAEVTSNPPGIIILPFFKYAPGYVATTTLEPGRGFWVRTSAAGTIILNKGASGGGGGEQLELQAYDKFTITDAGGRVQDLYVRNGALAQSAENIEMPPPPPDSLFDVRFVSGDFVRTVFPDSGSTSVSIALSDVVYPVEVNWDIHPENGITYSFTPDSGSGLGKSAPLASMSQSNSMTISRRGSGVIQLRTSSPEDGQLNLPTQFSLHQNYPNPFNPTTEIRFDLPDAGNVSLVVYDVLGRQVADLATGYQEAGYYSATWNASSVASGVYFARFNVTSAEGKVAFSKINKLMLMR